MQTTPQSWKKIVFTLNSFLMSISSQFLTLTPSIRAITDLLSVTIMLPLLESHICGIIHHVAFVFDCFQVLYHLWDYSCCICSIWLFIAEYYSIIMIIPQFICSLTDGHLSCLQFLTKEPTINTAAQIFVWICFQSSQLNA